MRIANNGTVSIASTTAGSSGAGALVVQGGISAAGASYFGGALNVAGAVTATSASTHTFGTTNTVTMEAGKITQLQAAGTVIQTLAHTSADSGLYQAWKTNTTTDRAYIGTANQVIGGGSIADFAINSVTGNVVLGTASAARLTIGSAGATFAGAVTTSAPTGGAGAWKLGIANTVTPTSPNRTITIEIGGTVYYLAAKTTND